MFEKLFGGLNMSWPFVVLFGVAAGVYTGAMGSIPALAQTSFHDIAVNYEWWVIFAFVIAASCKKNWECALKIFAFFLISQPLVYLTEVLAGALAPDMALYYYRAIWGPATLFTLPGGFIAFYITKQNPLGAIILGLGCAIEGILGLHYFAQFASTPPFHVLSAVVCFAAIFVMTFAIQKTAKNRAIALAVAVLATIAVVALTFLRGGVL